jgi:uncharacterized membrane protein YgcG
MDPSTSPILVYVALAGSLLVGLGLAWLFDPDRRSWRRAPVALENVNREPWFLGWLVAFFIGRPYSGGGGGEDGGGDAGGWDAGGWDAGGGGGS